MKSRNFEANLLSVVGPVTADAEVVVPHNLKIVPAAAFVVQRTKNARLYLGATAWTATNVYFKSNVASAAFRVLLVK